MPKNKENKKLKALRASKGLTQEDVAKVLGITKVAYQQKENGKHFFKTDEVNKMLAIFDCKYEDVFK